MWVGRYDHEAITGRYKKFRNWTICRCNGSGRPLPAVHCARAADRVVDGRAVDGHADENCDWTERREMRKRITTFQCGNR